MFAPEIVVAPRTRGFDERRDGLLKVCRRLGVSLPAAAVQFTAAHPAIGSIVVGARSPKEVDAILEGSRVPIPAEFWNELREARLIPDDAPTPN